MLQLAVLQLAVLYGCSFRLLFGCCEAKYQHRRETEIKTMSCCYHCRRADASLTHRQLRHAAVTWAGRLPRVISCLATLSLSL